MKQAGALKRFLAAAASLSVAALLVSLLLSVAAVGTINTAWSDTLRTSDLGSPERGVSGWAFLGEIWIGFILPWCKAQV